MTDEIVQTETPRGRQTVARVVDREPRADIATAAEEILTVESAGTTWRVTRSETEPV